MNHEKLHSVILIITILLGIVFSWDYKYSYAEKANKVETWTWLSPIQSNTTLSWATSNPKEDKPKIETKPIQDICDLKCKIKQLEKAWIKPELASLLVYECKKQDIEVVKCIKIWASILWAESSWWNKCSQYRCFGVSWIKFESYQEAVQDWVKRFWKYWFRQTTPSNFYSNTSKKPTTHYCLSEDSSGSTNSCPNWYKHSWAVYNKLNF